MSSHNYDVPPGMPASAAPSGRTLSSFELLISVHPPVLESLVSHLPTPALLQLYRTSRYLRCHLQQYPTVWNHLSFRVLHPSGLSLPTPTLNDSREGRERQSKPYALDQLLITLVAPHGTRLKTLDLDNTAVSGFSLINCVLTPRVGSLEHLSVRGCKNVSLKYHILPFLELQWTMSNAKSQKAKTGAGKSPTPIPGLALKSLYTYRCRHHRRRPYFASILKKKDSDPEPTHELVELCHDFGIWTDTAWCPTPNGRCLRRRDYHAGHSQMSSFSPGKEVWVVYDRLWRSSNRIGKPSDRQETGAESSTEGCFWEDAEYGYDGEALGAGLEPCQGEGKHVPAHLRSSHRIFTDHIRCDSCGDEIAERCEQCSVRMHCMGCRRTFCASCAFDRPLRERMTTDDCLSYLNLPPNQSLPLQPNASSLNPAGLPAPPQLIPSWFGQAASQSRPNKSSENRYWWATGAKRSPNLLQEGANNEDTESENEGDGHPFPAPFGLRTPNINLKWCCVEPFFSGGGGIVFPGFNSGSSPGADGIRTAPLPKIYGLEGRPTSGRAETEANPESSDFEDRRSNPKFPDPLTYLTDGGAESCALTGPRTLCQGCYAREDWRLKCQSCNRVLCKEHDLRELKMRVCGYADMAAEKRKYQYGYNEHTILIDAMCPVTIAAQFPLPGSDDAALFKEPEEDEGCDTPNALPPVSLPEDTAMRDVQRGQEASEVRSHRWQGCGAYFCPSPRPPGDSRGRCPAGMKQCTVCMVNECEACVAAFPSCDCSYCQDNFSCPNCHDARRVFDCKKTLEDEERRALQRREAIERTIQLEQRMAADDMAEKLGQFLVGLKHLDNDIDDFSSHVNAPPPC